MNPYRVDIQSAYKSPLPFSKTTVKTWVLLPLQTLPTAELTIRFVEDAEIQSLNQQYRNKNQPTNVLAFPSSIPSHISQDRPFIGDLIIAPNVLFEEHRNLKTTLDAHWAHILIHGVLHLLGHTHEEETDTSDMQALEKKYLSHFNFPDPYLMEHPDLE